MGWRRRVVATGLVLGLLAPGLASAQRKTVRRSLPPGSRIQRVVRGVAGSQNKAVEVDVGRLRAAMAPVAGRALLPRRSPRDEPYVAQSTSGYVRALVAPPGRSWPVSAPGRQARPEALALSFLREYRVAFGWSNTGASLSARSVRTRGGRSVVRFEQRLGGVPVFGAAATVQVDPSGGVPFVLADLARDDSSMYTAGFDTTPTVTGNAAAETARGIVPAERRATDLSTDAPVLMVFEPSVIGSAGPARLVWHLRVRSVFGHVDEVVLVDARTGAVAFHYSNVREAEYRKIYDAGNVPGSLGTLVRSEGDSPVGSPADVNLAYDYLGDTYDFFFDRLGRDSYDKAGAALVARVRYCPLGYACPYGNAFWESPNIYIGDGYAAADDVVAHELTHAVTEHEAALVYWGESGAIDEALADIFGEFVDLTNTGGTDTPGVRWQIGEDLPIGAIRNMADPTAFGDPDRRFSPDWYYYDGDNRGVHSNSGVADKLAYLLTDGGTFNGQTVTGQGITKVARLFYQADADLLVPASDYYDLYAALRQAAINLGWDGSAYEALEAACRAVEIDLPAAAVTVFSDGFEGSFPGPWEVIDVGGLMGTGVGTQWGPSTYRKVTGNRSAYSAGGGSSPAPPGGPYVPNMDTWMVYGPFSLASANRAWAEFDLFLDVEYSFDDVFFGVSTDGVTFDGDSLSPPPDGRTDDRGDGQSHWVHELLNFGEFPGYVGAPQVWFAFNFYSDYLCPPGCVPEPEGAYVDNVMIRQAIPQSADLAVTKTDGRTTVLPGLPVVYTVQVSNLGPDRVTNAHVVDNVPALLLDAYWTCSATSGSSCSSPGGNGDIDQLVSLLVGGSATYTVFGTLGSAASGSLVNTASVTVPEGFTDPAPANNSATDTDIIGTPSFLTIDDVSASEGDVGTTNFTFTVTLAPASAATVTVTYATVPGSATSGLDYSSTSGVLTFPPGQTSRPIVVPVVGDVLAEPDETFYVQLSGAVAALVTDGLGVGTILDDDGGGGAGVGVPGEIAHGFVREASLAALAGPVADEDFYLLRQAPDSSYEAVLDEISGDLQPLAVDRLDADATTVLQSAQATSGVGASRSLRWINPGEAVSDQLLRVRSGGCTTDCGADDTYRIRFYETTCSIPRFNNSGTQLTVLILQNPTDEAITGTVYYWSAGGALLASSAVSLETRSTLVVNTATVAGLAGRSGAITIAHDGHYGELSGKTVALEPATGFSFDSPMLWRAVP